MISVSFNIRALKDVYRMFKIRALQDAVAADGVSRSKTSDVFLEKGDNGIMQYIYWRTLMTKCNFNKIA